MYHQQWCQDSSITLPQERNKIVRRGLRLSITFFHLENNISLVLSAFKTIIGVLSRDWMTSEGIWSLSKARCLEGPPQYKSENLHPEYHNQDLCTVRGPNTDPWGTPLTISNSPDCLPSAWTHWVISLNF